MIDVENILKSFTVQNFLKSHIKHEQFENYFYIWNNGCYKDDNETNSIVREEISLSEYSSKVKYIEPFTSLNLSLKIKIKLLNLLTSKVLNETNTINILTGTNTNDTKTQEQINVINKFMESTNSNQSTQSINSYTNYKNLIIPIEYNNKLDIREQDDHLLIFIYTLLEKLKLNPIIISNDKFKWFNEFSKLNIKNFKFLYDFDKFEKKIIIDNQYTPDTYKFNGQYFLIPYVNYPYFENKLDNNYSLENKYCDIKSIFNIKFKKIQIFDFEKIKDYLFYYSFIETIPDKKLILSEIFEFIVKYIEYTSHKLNKIFDFLSSKTKDKIFKLSIGLGETTLINSINNNALVSEETVLLETLNSKLVMGIESFSKQDKKNYLIILDNYLILIEIYIILKFIVHRFITFKSYSESEINLILEFKSLFINKLCIIYDYVIGIYDSIDEHIYKIRKLSNSKLELCELFKKINTIYIYVRKQGFLKKNIF